MYADRLAFSPLLRGKCVALGLMPALANAAGNAVVQHQASGLEDVTALTWFFLLAFSFLGWVVADIDKAAELWNTDGHSRYEIWKQRLTLLKGIAASEMAGVCLYFLGHNTPDFLLRMLNLPTDQRIPEMGLFVLVTTGGYMGTRFFGWVERKYFGTSGTNA